jgi:hypothetical protein
LRVHNYLSSGIAVSYRVLLPIVSNSHWLVLVVEAVAAVRLQTEGLSRAATRHICRPVDWLIPQCSIDRWRIDPISTGRGIRRGT